jgi:hypothetical protein
MQIEIQMTFLFPASSGALARLRLLGNSSQRIVRRRVARLASHNGRDRRREAYPNLAARGIELARGASPSAICRAL